MMEEINTYPQLRDPEMKEILESFLIETKEILEKLDVDLVRLEHENQDTDLLNQVFRSFHTIKGTSGFFGLERLTSLTHKCEDILNILRKGSSKFNTGIMDSLLSAYDKIKELLLRIENNFDEDVYLDEVMQKLQKSVAELNGETEAESIEIIPMDIPVEKVSVQESAVPQNTVENAQSTSKAQQDNTIRVDIQRLDDLLNIVSELVLGRNRLAQVNSEFALENEGSQLSRDLSEAAKQIDLMTNELQLVVMKTRMVKIGKVFQRYPRVVRDLAKETQKQVKLILTGEDTELDKTLIEEINDPLVHLIRNAVDHAIELPEERVACGKDPAGTVILSAAHQGNNIIITVEDDGKGINPEVIKEKAISKGLISREKAKELTQTEMLNLIFIPGFSTASSLTNISGRGVGMDVVRTNVTKLRGMINIESKPGLGTKIIIKLPLTLAIIPGMIVKARKELFVIPLSSVVEVVRVDKQSIKSINGREVIKMRDNIIPLIDVIEFFESLDGNNEEKVWQYVVVVGVAEKRFGIKVDELIGQKEIVIKTLGNYLGNIRGIAGSTIMGDGRVVMIFDLAELIARLESALV